MFRLAVIARLLIIIGVIRLSNALPHFGDQCDKKAVGENKLFKSKSVVIAKCMEYSASVYTGEEPRCDSTNNNKKSPYFAEIVYKRQIDGLLFVYTDGGSLISSRYVLAAANSFNKSGRTPVQVTLGATNVITSVNNGSTVKYDVEKTVVHPNYESSSVYNDLVLIKLSKNVIFSLHIHPICLPDADIQPIVVNRAYYLDRPDAADNNWPLVVYKRQSVPLGLCNVTYDNLDFPQGINDDFFCTSSMDLFDSNYTYNINGAPITIEHGSVKCSHLILGVSSITHKNSLADIAVKVYNYREWIEGVIWVNGEDY